MNARTVAAAGRASAAVAGRTNALATRLRAREALASAAVWSAAACLVGVFGWLLADLVRLGAGEWSWAYFTDAPARSGRAGGIAPILVSTLALLGIALAVALPLALAVAFWLSEYTRRAPRAGQMLRAALDVLAGTPSIVFGLFGNAFFCLYLGLGFSLLAGGLTLACMILPLVARTAEAALAAVPDSQRHAAAALGLSQPTTLLRVLLPAAVPGLLAGTLLGSGRALAETAALVFTSGYVDRMPESLADSGRALAVHIYDLAMNVAGGDARAYAAALTLIVLVLAVNALAVALAGRWITRLEGRV
jgi:phosphate transport system permease protein